MARIAANPPEIIIVGTYTNSDFIVLSWDVSLRSRPPLKDEADCLGFVCVHGNLLGRAPQLLVPGFNGISARRQAGQMKTAVLGCCRKIGMLKNGNIPFHPRVNVAFHRDCNLFSSESFFCCGPRQLSLVPFAVIDGYRMDIVGSWIVIHHFQTLICPHGHYMRFIHAALLMNDDRLTRRFESAVS